MGGCHSLGGSTWWLLDSGQESLMTVTIEYVLSAHILEKLVEGTKIGQLGMYSSPKSPPGISLPVNVAVHKQENNQLLSIDQVHKLVTSRDRYSPIYICYNSDQCK